MSFAHVWSCECWVYSCSKQVSLQKPCTDVSMPYQCNFNSSGASILRCWIQRLAKQSKAASQPHPVSLSYNYCGTIYALSNKSQQSKSGYQTRSEKERKCVDMADCAVRRQRQAKLQSALEDLLLTIVRIVNEKKEHIPPVVSANTLTFPFDISIAGFASLLTGNNCSMCRKL